MQHWVSALVIPAAHREPVAPLPEPSIPRGSSKVTPVLVRPRRTGNTSHAANHGIDPKHSPTLLVLLTTFAVAARPEPTNQR